MTSSDADHRDAERIRHFLDKIEADQRKAVSAINARVAQECAHIRAQAFTASRQFFRTQAEQARRQQQVEHDRMVSRARTAARRENWHLLQEALEESLWAVGQAMQAQWHDADAQGRWCLSWLEQALEHAHAGALLHVRLGAGALPDTRVALQRHLDGKPVEYRISEAEREKPGIVIEWGDYVLDGTLAAQRPRLESMLFAQLAQWLHAQESGPPNPSGG